MMDHERAALVSDLAAIAREYGQTQQLRERISQRVTAALAAPLVEQPAAAPDAEPSNIELRGLWYGAGGSFHGPNVETGTMPEEKLLPFLRSLIAAQPAQPAAKAEPEYNGWYCAHCKRGVDARDVTFSEQHAACGRRITDDRPPVATEQPATQAGAAEPVTLAVDLPERVVDVVAGQANLSGPFSDRFYLFAQMLKDEVIARLPRHCFYPAAHPTEQPREDAELGRVAMRFVDRAGDPHPGVDDAERICAEFYAAMCKVLEPRWAAARAAQTKTGGA